MFANRDSTWLRDHFCAAATIQTYNVERVLADIDADDGDGGTSCLGHGVLLVFGAPCQLLSLEGQEHGRTIPLADARCFRCLLAICVAARCA
jgi:hypothetical protein